jgi:hypothetical protein
VAMASAVIPREDDARRPFPESPSPSCSGCMSRDGLRPGYLTGVWDQYPAAGCGHGREYSDMSYASWAAAC